MTLMERCPPAFQDKYKVLADRHSGEDGEDCPGGTKNHGEAKAFFFKCFVFFQFVVTADIFVNVCLPRSVSIHRYHRLHGVVAH